MKSSVTEGAIVLAGYFSIRADIPSGPVAFVLSSCLSRWHTSSSAQGISVDEMVMFPNRLEMLVEHNGGVFQLVEKNS